MEEMLRAKQDVLKRRPPATERQRLNPIQEWCSP
jgi:hypothetical protein